jgi:transposase-like protein
MKKVVACGLGIKVEVVAEPVGSLCSREESSSNKIGRPSKLDQRDRDEILRIKPFYSIRQLARIFEVSRSSIMRVLKNG